MPQCLSCGKELKKGFFAKNTDVPYPSNPDVCFVCGMEGKTGLAAPTADEMETAPHESIISGETPSTADKVAEESGSTRNLEEDEVHQAPEIEVELSGIAAYVHDGTNDLLHAILDEIDKPSVADSEFQRLYGVDKDGIVDFLLTDTGPDLIWSAMTRRQQLLALDWADMDQLIDEFVKPESAADLGEETEEDQDSAHQKLLFRVKDLKGFDKHAREFVHIVLEPDAEIHISHSASPDSGKTLGVMTSEIVAAEIVTPVIYANRDEYVTQAVQPNKLTNAAAGAALGFLLAGPLGTAVGSLYGASSSSGGGRAVKKIERESDGVGLIGFSSGAGIIVTMSKHTVDDFHLLKSWVEQVSIQKSQAEVAAEYKECPMCAEDVKARAKICRFCGHSFV